MLASAHPLAQVAISLAISFAVSAAIAALTPATKTESPRLNDLSAPKSNYGTRIPKIWGSVRVAGNLIWANPIREQKAKKRGGKGGPKTEATNYTYFGSFAMLLCEGPILGIRRIWLSSKLVYNLSDDADAATIANSIKFRDRYLRIYKGTATQPPDPLIQASMGIENTPAYRYRAYIVFDDLPLADYGNRLPVITAEVVTCGSVSGSGQISANPANLAGIIHEICLSTGLSSAEIDVSEIDQPVTGFFLSTAQSARDALSQLQQAYFFDCVESGGKLKFINSKRPGITQSIAVESLASHEFGQNRPNNYEEKRTQDLELPSEISVTYLDPSFNYGEAVQYSRKSVAANSNAQSVSLSIVLTSSEAKTIADRLLYLAWTKRREIKFNLSLRHCLLEPADIISLLLERTQELQISKLNVGANLLLEVEAIGYEPSIFNHIATVETGYCETIDNPTGQSTYQLSRRLLLRLAGVRSGSTTYTPGDDYTHDLIAGTVARVDGGSIPDGATLTICYELDEVAPPPQIVSVAGNASLRILDIPLVLDGDTDNGLYIAAAGSEDWRFASIYVSRNGGSSYEFAKNLTARSTFGRCNGVLAAGSTNELDTTNTLSVTLLTEGELESFGLADLDTGLNTALVGNEIIRFQTATLTGRGLYTLSNLQRGRRGTEWAVGTHAAGESFYVLSDYLERIEGGSADIGRTLHFKALTEGQSLDDVSAISLVVAGNSLKPYAPINVAATKDSAGNITITWIRRDRKAGNRTDYANFPLSEISEKYEIVIYQGATPKRTLTSFTTYAEYAASLQTADFGNLVATLSVRIYQISATVGRGNAAIASLSPSLYNPPPTITNISPRSGAVGAQILISGTNFAGATSVAFNGTAASFTVDSGTQIAAIVPSGASSGPISVTTPGGTAQL